MKTFNQWLVFGGVMAGLASPVTMAGGVIRQPLPPIFPGERFAEVTCRDSAGIPDYGFEVIVEACDNGPHSFIANLNENTIAGPVFLKKFRVTGKLNGTTQTQTYRGKGFRLEIPLVGLPRLGEVDFTGQLIAEVKGRRIVESLTCRFSNVLQPVRPNPFISICMAYWTGYEIDRETGACVRGGRSGCSNPFPFTTLEECEASK